MTSSAPPCRSPRSVVAFLVFAALFVAPATQGAGVVSRCDETALANALIGGGKVTFACSGTITLTATITIATDTTIAGGRRDRDGTDSDDEDTGRKIVIINGAGMQVFNVLGGVTLKLEEITITGGSASIGGGLFNLGTVNIVSSTFFSNVAAFAGGAIANFGVMTVRNSAFYGNTAQISGGGAIDNNGTLTVIDSRFYGNTTGGEGGAILNDGTTTVSNSIFTGNSATSGGAAIENNSGTVALASSIVADSAGTNCSGVITDQGGNLTADSSCPGTLYELGSVPSSGTTCSGFYSNTFKGDVLVSEGQICGFVSGGILGNIDVEGGKLFLGHATVTGSVQIHEGGTVSIGPGTVIQGSLQIENPGTAAGRNQICGAAINGDLQVDGTESVEIGGPASSSCSGNAIGGNLHIQQQRPPESN